MCFLFSFVFLTENHTAKTGLLFKAKRQRRTKGKKAAAQSTKRGISDCALCGGPYKPF